jgi:hypothetical protein
MLSAQLKHRLRDSDYFDLHLKAAAILRSQEPHHWYDSLFLRAFEAARTFLGEVSPHKVDSFVAGFAPLQPPAGFRQSKVANFLSASEFARVRREVAAIGPQRMELHEVASFGREILHDHPYFRALQNDLLERVSAMAGVTLEPGYTFLSLYGPDGVCGLHMDQPLSMFTLDLCIDQSHEWPIHFSDPIDWQRVHEFGNRPTVRDLVDAGVGFTSDILRPNEAVLFCGSSQWHYREPFAQDGFCNLLFLHYFPKGCGALVDPSQWADHFSMPELQALCDLFDELNSIRKGQADQ